MKLSGYHKTIITHKTCISDFRLRWPKVRSILWPPHYKAMGENKIFPIRFKFGYITITIYIYTRILLMIQVQILVDDLHRGHLGSPEVTNMFLRITQNWEELETWAWPHCACLVTTHRYRYATWPTWVKMWPRVILTRGQIFTWPFKVSMYMFRRALTRGIRCYPNYAASFLNWKIIRKWTFLTKTDILRF